jgi:protein-disulfide isomerase
MSEQKKLTKKERRAYKKKAQMEKEVAKNRKTTMRKMFTWGVVVAIAMAVGIFFKAAFTPTGGSTTTFELQENDNTKGSDTAPNMLVEYSDFQCPACAHYYPIISRLEQEHGDEVLVVYRHFPLRNSHKNAQLAAQASEAAALQGAFWDMHDMLFANQAIWSAEKDPTNTFVSYAADIGLDTEQFASDLTSEVVVAKVNTDYDSGIQSRVNATPTFFFNGKKVSVSSYESFENLLE